MVEIYSPFTVSCLFDHSFFQQFINFVLNDVLLLKGKTGFPWDSLLLREPSREFNFILSHTISH